MSHRKVYSHGSIPFSWEDIPGVRKAATPCHDKSHRATRSSSDALDTVVSQVPDGPGAQKFAIPPPPRMADVTRRTSSGKGFWVREVDPFLAAYKECTKVDSGTTLPKTSAGQSKKPNSKFGVRKSTTSLFSCKSSCDVNEDNFMRLTQLPPLPRSSDRMNRAIR